LIVFTIVMGFFLPSAMGVYWLIGGLISMAQTIITQLVLGKGKKKKGK
jgi:membrane protein insertase Oxa1/YidC/SpoIIIJ